MASRGRVGGAMRLSPEDRATSGHGVRELAEEGGPLTVERAAEMGRKDPTRSFLQRATAGAAYLSIPIPEVGRARVAPISGIGGPY